MFIPRRVAACALALSATANRGDDTTPSTVAPRANVHLLARRDRVAAKIHSRLDDPDRLLRRAGPE